MTRSQHAALARRPAGTPAGSSVRSIPAAAGLEQHGSQRPGYVFWNLGVAALYEEALRRREGQLAEGGALVVRTGQHTGRSPNDKFIVREAASAEHVWWGNGNRPLDARRFDALHARVLAYLTGKDLFVQDGFVGAEARYRRPIRVITETAWHSLFARTMFRPAQTTAGPTPPAGGNGASFAPEFTVLHAPNFLADPERDGTISPTFILVHFGRKLILIGGTSYAGEIKKSVCTIMNYLLPLERVLSMHCAANIGPSGDVAIFFGLSGTGKTSLSADARRTLIGDDEHGWSDRGIFNGKHARRLPHRVHCQCERNENGRSPVEHHQAHLRCLRHHAADRPAHPRAGDVPVHLRLHGEGRRDGTGHHRAEGDLHAPVSVRPSWRCGRACTRSSWASISHGTASGAGS